MMRHASDTPGVRLALPQVTLCAVTSVNVAATIRALEACLAQVDFGVCKLLTDVPVTIDNPRITLVPIRRLGDSKAYSDFLLSQLVDHVETPHCLVAQWDGHLIDADRWRPEFLDFDYIGASWPQFDDGHDVGNGGFSLRSRRLMVACRDQRFRIYHPEDIATCRINRDWLESVGMRFAPRSLADMFASERAGDLACCFGYHGVFNMIKAIGPTEFKSIYRSLDDRATVRHDFADILKQLRYGQRGVALAARLIADQAAHSIRMGRRK